MTALTSYELRNNSIPLNSIAVSGMSPIEESAQSLEKKANFYLFSKDYKFAIEYFVKAIKAYGETKKHISNCYYGIAQAYFRLNDFDKAEIIYNKVLCILKEEPDDSLKSDVLAELSEVYICKSNYQKAEKILAYQINERQFSSLDNDIQIVKKCLSRLGDLYNRLGKCHEASAVIKQSAEMNKRHFGIAL